MGVGRPDVAERYTERALLVDPFVDRRLSPVSIWEAAIKREAGRLRAPFNRVLIARALQEDLAVLTRDRALADYGVRLAA